MGVLNKQEFENEPVEQSSIFKSVTDTFMAAAEWTKNRTVVVFRRERNGRQYVRCRTFNRHQIKKPWYPSPRFYRAPMDCAEELGKAIIAAARGEQNGPVPGWRYDFDKQYQAEEWRRLCKRRQHGRGLALIHPTPTQSSMRDWYADFVAVKAKKLMLGFRRSWYLVADAATERRLEIRDGRG